MAESSIRAARPADVPRMVDLSEQKRLEYQGYQPNFWRKAAGSRETQIARSRSSTSAPEPSMVL